jgi:hypothetical protein
VPRDLVFISYSHADKVWLERLRIFLKPFTRRDLQVWLDPYIETATIGDAKSPRRCRAAASVYCSSAAISSDFIYDEELPALLASAKAGEVTLFPVPISASGYKETELVRFQFAHPPDDPLDGLSESERNAALVKIVERIAAAVRKAPNVAATSVDRPTPEARAALAPMAPTGGIALLHGVPGQRPNLIPRPISGSGAREHRSRCRNNRSDVTGRANWLARHGRDRQDGPGHRSRER